MEQKKRKEKANQQIGRNLRALRQSRNLTQEQIGDVLGMTFQQVQKYETGKNRISGGSLVELSNFFKVPIYFFFSGTQKLHDWEG